MASWIRKGPRDSPQPAVHGLTGPIYTRLPIKEPCGWLHSRACEGEQPTSHTRFWRLWLSKTRAVIELLSQHWGFYFNASSDDWGSSDMIPHHSTVQKHLSDTRDSPTVDQQLNNAFARKITLLLFLSRLLIFKYCLSVLGCAETFTSARWTLLQVCPHVLFDDLFNVLFRKLLELRHHRELDLSDVVSNVFEDVKRRLVGRGCLPKIKDDTRLLVINDEAQFLGDQFNGPFQSMSSSDKPPRPFSPQSCTPSEISVSISSRLSPVGLVYQSILFSGFRAQAMYLEFPGWTSKESISTYISRVRHCLHDEQSNMALDKFLSEEAVEMLFQKIVGRYRPAINAIERIVEGNDPGAWKKTVEDAEDKLVSWANRHIKGNLCYEMSRLNDKHTTNTRISLTSPSTAC
ncbi:hypothetical protein B0O80DRAFT_266271 [Mortierella sp. GBAus27b]|nr:hypothetical protein B0O80DRAFT_266271 [Mortierella sp. GBAus27b]